MIGPAIGGALIATVGLTPLFLGNAAFLYSGTRRFVLDEGKRASICGSRIRWERATIRRSSIRPVPSRAAQHSVDARHRGNVTYEFTFILPLFARFTFHREAGGFAALVMARGLGSAIGGLYSASRRKTTATMLPVAALLLGLAVLAAVAAPTLALAVIAMTVIGLCSIIFLSLGNVILQQHSDPLMLGRVMSFWTVAFLGSTPSADRSSAGSRKAPARAGG